MKNLLIILAVFFTVAIKAQISSSQKLAGNLKEIKKENFEYFKNTTTIFILSNVFEKEQYESILKNNWTVTPYEIVDINELDRTKYLNGKYSFAELQAYSSSKQKNGVRSGLISVISLINFYFINPDKLNSVKESLSKLKKAKKNYQEKSRNIFSKNKERVADIFLAPNGELLRSLYKNDGVGEKSLFSKDLFVNYKLGYLKNYFQKVSSLISENKSYWLYAQDFLPELKKLKENTLIISKYQKLFINRKKADKFEALMEDYDYEYDVKEEEEINQKILDGEEFYYLNFTRINSGARIINIFNSKSGEIVLRHHLNPGMKFTLTKKQIQFINKSVNSL
ncbi:hypothetical protein [Lacinutrix mariniflava]|uniref:hypothetical protein n=1 Tax=Lacinutrix mariniflava TaxID=342955 RepID=UPI0006E2DD7C|nr:hypothetical protein [Lacinutrix mariniflava]